MAVSGQFVNFGSHSIPPKQRSSNAYWTRNVMLRFVASASREMITLFRSIVPSLYSLSCCRLVGEYGLPNRL